jgi:26S proteasome regulatory subunit N8
MIGWYHTGPKLRASDQEINELFKRFVARPVMVIVDVRPNTVGIPTDAYFAVEEIKDVRLVILIKHFIFQISYLHTL